ncbi:MAG: TlpA family protein disulfide reductase [Aristaeellaceae bacterium]
MKTMKLLTKVCVLTLVMMLALLGTAAAENVTDRYEYAGIAFTYDAALVDKGLMIDCGNMDAHGGMYMDVYCMDPVIEQEILDAYYLARDNGDEEATAAAVDEYYAHCNDIAEIVMMEKAYYETCKADGTLLFDETEMTSLGEHNDHLYWVYFYSVDPDSKREVQSETEIANWLEIVDALGDLSEVVEYIPVVKQDRFEVGGQFPAFATSDIAGNEVTEAIFAGKDLTVFHIWGTYCTPCISEMPDIGVWVREMPENVQFIGLLVDVHSGDTKLISLAETILSKANADFTNLMMTDELSDYLDERVTGVPTTIFVNSNGELVGDIILGTNIEKYKQIVEDYLNAQ